MKINTTSKARHTKNTEVLLLLRNKVKVDYLDLKKKTDIINEGNLDPKGS